MSSVSSSAVRVSMSTRSLFVRGAALRALHHHIEVGERRARVEELRLLLPELVRLRQVRVLHRRLVRVEEGEDDVVIRVVAVTADETLSQRALALGRRAPLLLECFELLESRRTALDDLDEPGCCHALPCSARSARSA